MPAPPRVHVRDAAAVMRRHQSDDINQDFGTVWPATFDDDWCGEGRRPDDIDFEDFWSASLTTRLKPLQ